MSGILVAALGHAWLKDCGFGLKVIELLRQRPLPPQVELADWSFGTITAYQKLASVKYSRAVFVAPAERNDVEAGALAIRRPAVSLPTEEEIHARIVDCVMGAVSLENLLIIGRFYGALPSDVVIIQALPVDDGWGNDLSPTLAALLEPAARAVLNEVERPLS